MPIHNHQFVIAFSVVTPNAADQVSAMELRNALARRLRELGASQRAEDEIQEACAYNADSFTYGADDQVPALDADGSSLPRVLVEVSGGVVQGVSADSPDAVDLAVADYDTEDCQEGDTGIVKIDRELVNLHQPVIHVMPQRLEEIFALLAPQAQEQEPSPADAPLAPRGGGTGPSLSAGQAPALRKGTPDMTLRELRAAGFAVTVFSPEELQGADRTQLESRLVEEGNEMISLLRPSRRSELERG